MKRERENEIETKNHLNCIKFSLRSRLIGGCMYAMLNWWCPAYFQLRSLSYPLFFIFSLSLSLPLFLSCSPQFAENVRFYQCLWKNRLRWIIFVSQLNVTLMFDNGRKKHVHSAFCYQMEIIKNWSKLSIMLITVKQKWFYRTIRIGLLPAIDQLISDILEWNKVLSSGCVTTTTTNTRNESELFAIRNISD